MTFYSFLVVIKALQKILILYISCLYHTFLLDIHNAIPTILPTEETCPSQAKKKHI